VYDKSIHWPAAHVCCVLQVLVLARANGVESAAAKTGSSDTRFSELW
jgi:hypothetical protein